MSTDELVEDIYQKFISSNYPLMAFDFELGNIINLHIRIPPSYPKFILDKNDDIKTCASLCPAIETIEISAEYQNKGIFKKLVSRLLSDRNIECVFVTNVSNESFKDYLMNSLDWQKLDIRSPLGLEFSENHFFKR